MSVIIRKASVDDAEGIGKVHVDSWRSTYAGLLSAEFLASLSYEKRTEFWRRELSRPAENECLFVAENEPGKILGFVCAGKAIEIVKDDLEYSGEVYAIYLLSEAQGHGTGRQLMQAAADYLYQHGFHSMALWVLKDNSAARRFYEKMGGSFIREKLITIGTQTLTEVAYGWKGLSGLLNKDLHA